MKEMTVSCQLLRTHKGGMATSITTKMLLVKRFFLENLLNSCMHLYSCSSEYFAFLLMENITAILTDQNVKKGAPETLVSPRSPTTPTEVIYLSNIDQTVAFPVETIFFYEAPLDGRATISDIIDRVKTSVSEVLLVPYYFMAGRLQFNFQTHRLDLVCNNAGASFVGAAASLRLEDLGDLSLPNPSFQHLIVRVDEFEGLGQTPLFTIQVTRFRCGGLSIGFVTNHCLLDGRSAAEMFENLAAICRGEGMKTQLLNVDRSCIRARDPPQIKYQHAEYVKLEDVSSLSSSFTLPTQANPLPSLKLTEKHKYRLFSFSSSMIKSLKEKAMRKCSTFEAIVAHIWKARTRAIFDNPLEMCSLLFAVDIRTRLSPPLPEGFTGNAVITASASAKVVDLAEKPISFGVEMVRQAIERVTDDYVRSAIDWLEVHRGMPSTMNGSFYVSAWWKLPFHELDFGWGNPLYGGPVVSGMDEFVLLLSDGSCRGREGGINVWISLDEERMEKFMDFVFDL